MAEDSEEEIKEKGTNEEKEKDDDVISKKDLKKKLKLGDDDEDDEEKKTNTDTIAELAIDSDKTLEEVIKNLIKARVNLKDVKYFWPDRPQRQSQTPVGWIIVVISVILIAVWFIKIIK